MERFTDPIEGSLKIYQQGKEYVIEVGITDRDIYVADLSDEKYIAQSDIVQSKDKRCT